MGAIPPSLPLRCPTCARPHELDERFCVDCGMPLVYAAGAVDDPPLTEQQERVRKIKRQYAEGRLVRVAAARNLTEAEFISGLLLEEGVPSLIRRSAGFDVPDFLAAGPRDILVPESGVAAARDILLEADLLSTSSGSAAIAPRKLAAALVGGVALIGAVVLIGYAAQSDAQPEHRKSAAPPSVTAR